VADAKTNFAAPGVEVDLAMLGYSRTWEGNPGIEWDEPRDVRRVEVDFEHESQIPPEDAVRIEYWVSSWPQRSACGWTKTDSPWQGE
jgi:hypothetical protein